MTGRASEISAADERSEGSSANAGRSESVIPYIARRYILCVRMGRGVGRGRQSGCSPNIARRMTGRAGGSAQLTEGHGRCIVHPGRGFLFV